MGITNSRDTVPTVGLSPATPLSEAGHVMEPSVSVPIPRGLSPPASAAPVPEEEPPAERSRAHGLATSPPVALQPLEDLVERMLAHSLKFVLARMIAPASLRLTTSGASRVGLPMREVDPARPGSPTASMLSLIITGTPCSAPREIPLARSSSRSRATDKASSFTAAIECSEVGVPSRSMFWIRSISAVTNWEEVRLPLSKREITSCALK